MEPNLAIELKGVNKTFKVEVEDSTKERNAFNRFPTKTVENKVLDNFNLKVKKGELLGVIGLNGSGKSTLLSIMARIMEPDSGTIEIDGKVSSILELGMGFHQDLSGRENIYIKGEMYGFSKKQIDERVDDIIDFAGIRNYIDNPLRTYSSGMSGRLAFSIMIHVDADVMLLDEIMSTGDPSFTNKANLLFNKQLRSGKTVVFASQNASQIEQLCTRAIWINKGRIVADGTPKSVCAMFQNSINDSVEMISEFANSGIADAQYKLALLYRDGNKVGKDEELYKVWLGKAASQGHTLAQVAYADLLIKSDSEQDRSDAFAFYQSAALKGNGDARMKLSALSNNSRNVTDLKEIRGIIKQLAEKGHPSNKYQYALLMLRTAWNDDDRKEAMKWFQLSSEDGNPDAFFQMAVMYRDGIGVPRDNEKYVSLLESAAAIGHVDSIRMLADIYLAGKITVKDDAKAFLYASKGAEMGISGMQYQLATMYRDGIGTDPDKELAEKWFYTFSNSNLANFQYMAYEQMKLFDVDTEATPESLLLKAAAVGNLRAINTLATLYRGDSVIAVDSEKSKHYFKLAASWPGSTRLTLADLYYKGTVFDQNLEEAANLYKTLTYCCNADIDYRLYLMYHNGMGFEKNDEEAMKYLKRSASRGNLDAKMELRKASKQP